LLLITRCNIINATTTTCNYDISMRAYFRTNRYNIDFIMYPDVTKMVIIIWKHATVCRWNLWKGDDCWQSHLARPGWITLIKYLFGKQNYYLSKKKNCLTRYCSGFEVSKSTRRIHSHNLVYVSFFFSL